MKDRQIDIATGVSRKTKLWKNTRMLWSELLRRLEQVTRTAETVAEYKAMGVSQQSQIKDVGGFVGGYCNNGNRSDVRHRSVLSLDADYADPDVWDDWATLIGHAAAMYSTHKHQPDHPRIRLVIPLARDVSPDEYQAIGRRVASMLGIDKFDDTTYQPQRLMYWPSCSRDGEFLSDHLDGELLDPDEILSTYYDWHDISAWPMSSRVAEIARKTASRQQDPTEKSGLIGAFCRAYSIDAAIEAYVPTYQPCGISGRYTYTEGSTAAGVVTYDGKYSYSHHATDPASGQLCNAWDLVRLHKFGAQDGGCDPDTRTPDRPSYKAMTQLATDDPAVRAQLVSDKMSEAADDYAADPDDDAWRSRLGITGKGGVAQTIDNAVIILEHDPALRGCIATDEMEHQIVAVRDLPWRKISGNRQWSDADDAALRYYLERTYGLSGKDRILDATNVVAQQNAFHPVRDYLKSCTWDGVPRLDTLLVDYLGASDSEYVRAVTRKTFVAAVSRIFRPGCKFDYVLTLQGRQGQGKSKLISRLAGRWFSDTLTAITGKDAMEQVQGVWVLEIAELTSLRKAEVEAIKGYVSKRVDRFRPAYGRRTQEFPRQCIFIGTTNETEFLRDTTGNRRFWVVDLPNPPRKQQDAELTDALIANIWGEALEYYRRGEPLYLGPRLEAKAREAQTAYEVDNPLIGVVEQYLDRKLPDDWDDRDVYARRQWLDTGSEGTVVRESVCALEIWAEALGRNPDRLDRYGVMEIHAIMSRLPEWQRMGARQKTFSGYGRQKYYDRRQKR